MLTIAKTLALTAGSALVAALLLSGTPAFAKSHSAGAHHRHSAGASHAGSHAKKNKKRSSPDARKLFSAVKVPSNQTPASIGEYWNGCLAGASTLPVDGPHWQVMRLSRNRHYGRAALVDYIKNFSDRAHNAGWNGLLIGDMNQPRGGPMPSGHASHQIGLDADIWLTPAPQNKLTDEERETMDAHSVLKIDSADLDPNIWTPEHAAMVKEAAQDSNVQRIFVTPAIKKYLCDRKDPRGADTEWLRRLRPYEGHDEHIHVRLFCPKGDGSCSAQEAPPAGDGCGSELTDWLQKVANDPPYTSKPAPFTPKTPFPLSSLPNACKAVLTAKP
jgi:penicillin-insensitive murein endopeptidase